MLCQDMYRTNLTGDDFVDSADLSIVDNNSLLSVTLDETINIIQD